MASEDAEVEICRYANVSVDCVAEPPTAAAAQTLTLTLTLTSFRLLLPPHALHLRLVRAVDQVASLQHGRRVRVQAEGGLQFLLCFPRHADGLALAAHLRFYADKKSWLMCVPASVRTRSAPTLAGVGGVMRRQERDMSAASAVRQDVADLAQLVRRANEVLGLVEQYCAIASASGGVGACEADELGGILADMGVVAPVTLLTSGSRDEYLRRLGAQVAQLLTADRRIQRLGGMVALTDAYCLCNKARGSALCSPADFLSACALLGEGLVLTEYASGVKVIRLAALDADGITARLLAMAEARGCVGAAEVSRALRVPLVPAKELLLTAESSGALCRDESISGLFFFPNRFDSLAIS